jgi:hypothetical protein
LTQLSLTGRFRISPWETSRLRTMASFETRSPSEKHQRLAAALSKYILTYASHILWLGNASLFTLRK